MEPLIYQINRHQEKSSDCKPSNQMLFLIVCIFLFNAQVFSQVSKCTSQATCSSCIQAGPDCVWCNDETVNLTSVERCDHYSKIKRKCQKKIINPPKNYYEIQEEEPIGKTGTRTVQLTPQRILMKLRPNAPVNITVTFQQVKNYPIDLYYLMDLSYTMKNDKEKLVSLGHELGKTLKRMTDDYRIGFGSFIDKRVAPFVSVHPDIFLNPCGKKEICASAYGFINDLPLTKNINTFMDKVSKSKISGNIDTPEGGLDAMMQSIVCTNQIGWREKARKILLLATDDEFHFAGDGKLGGIVEPNDGYCHLSSAGEYTKSTEQDYPSINQIRKKVLDKDINVIFAVTEDMRNLYNDLSKVIEGSYSATLDNDSSNIVKLVEEQYKKITSTVDLRDNATSNVEVTYQVTCPNRGKGSAVTKISNKCENLPIGEKAEFTIGVELKTCPTSKQNRKQILEISPVGLSEKLIVTLDFLCECDCENSKETMYPSDKCSSNGAYECSICRCLEGRYGEHCECDEIRQTDTTDDTLCKKGSSSFICSGRGQCNPCGKCVCQKPKQAEFKVYGTYCECDNYNCDKHDELLCGGHGECDCGQCKCQAKWTGPACECPSTEESCTGPSGDVCSGKANGRCECGKCKCVAPFGGKFCQENLTPGGKCIDYRNCAQCLGFPEFSITSPATLCSICNSSFSVEIVSVLKEPEQGEHKCTFKDDESCNFYFTYIQLGDESLPKLTIQSIRVCPEPLDLYLIIGSILGGILLIGLIVLLIWKLVTYFKDKREYEKFMKECSDPKWAKNENPMYRKPVQRFSNPMFGRLGDRFSKRVSQMFSK